jgi:hypothetical protein
LERRAKLPLDSPGRSTTEVLGDAVGYERRHTLVRLDGDSRDVRRAEQAGRAREG